MSEISEKKRTLGDLLKHPLANVIICFLLTGVVGTSLTQYYIFQRQKQALQQELSTARKKSIATLSALNSEYIARAEMLLAAVDRGDDGSVKKLEETLDDATVRWRTESNPTLLVARDVLPPEIYIQFRERLKKEFHGRFLVPFSQCLTDARNEKAEGRDMASVLQDCKAHQYLTQASICSQSLLDMLYELSDYTVAGNVEDALKVNREKYRGVLKEACAIPE